MYELLSVWRFGTADIVGDLPPLICCVLVFSIPVIAILTKHQRKMAEIFHQRHPADRAVDPNTLVEVAQLRAEVTRLRDLVNQQVLERDRVVADPLPGRVGAETQGVS